MNPELPIVTVITPTFNQAGYLIQAIESVLSQDYPSIEYIVINDGSKDCTEEILRNYDGRIDWETQENMGECHAINKGIEKARGEYLLILSSDDYLLPGAIRSLVQYMLDHPYLVIVYPDYNIVNEDNEIVQFIRNYDYNYINAVRWFACMPGPGALIKRSLFIRLGGRDPQFKYVGDFDFYLRAGLLGQFDRVPQTLACYRWHTGSQTQHKSYRQAEEHLQLIRKYYSQPNLPNAVREVKSEAFSSAYYIAGVVCSDNPNNWKKRWYFLRAILFVPKKYFGIYFYRFEKITLSFLGENLQRNLIRWIKQQKTNNKT